MVDEPTIYSMLERARAFVDDGKNLHATQMYYALLDVAPHVEDAWLELANLFIDQGQHEAAERILVRASDTVRASAEFTFLVGKLYFKMGDSYHALSSFRKVASVERSLPQKLNVQLQYNLALLYYHKENWRLAEHYFLRTKALDPRFPKINESLAELQLKREAVTEALESLQEAVRIEPYSWIGHYLLGVASVRLQQWHRALEEFTQAIDMNPKEPRAWQMCGDVLLNLERYDESEQYLRKALELNPDLTDAMVGFGFLFLKRNELEQAGSYFKRALMRDPGHARAKQGERELLHALQLR